MNKFIGSTLLVTGTTLGAGMLALPMVSAAAGFGAAAALLIGMWGLMIFTGLLILEVNLAFDLYHNHFGTMAEKTLGLMGKIVTLLCCLLLLYALTAAYIAGDASLLSTYFSALFHHTIPNWVSAILFTVIFGSFVYWNARAVDIVNRGLLSLKGILLFIALILLMPHIQLSHLARAPHSSRLIFACAPIFLCSFGFHHIIPSLTNYVGKKPNTLKWIIILGVTIPLVIYLLWLFMTFSVLPLDGTHSFNTLIKTKGSVGKFVGLIVLASQSHWVSIGINGFSSIAMTTSFLGVSLGLFDFLADTTKRKNTKKGRLQTAFLTFIPPLLFALFFQKGFIMALGIAAIFVAILEIILPALMVWKLRKDKTLHSPFRTKGGTVLLIIAILIGLGLIGLQLQSYLM